MKKVSLLGMLLMTMTLGHAQNLQLNDRSFEDRTKVLSVAIHSILYSDLHLRILYNLSKVSCAGTCCFYSMN